MPDFRCFRAKWILTSDLRWGNFHSSVFSVISSVHEYGLSCLIPLLTAVLNKFVVYIGIYFVLQPSNPSSVGTAFAIYLSLENHVSKRIYYFLLIFLPLCPIFSVLCCLVHDFPNQCSKFSW